MLYMVFYIVVDRIWLTCKSDMEPLISVLILNAHGMENVSGSRCKGVGLPFSNDFSCLLFCLHSFQREEIEVL